MTRSHNDLVLGVFEDQDHALRAIHHLRESGFEDEHLGLVAREWVGGEVPADVRAQRVAGNAAMTGALTGAGIGAAAGLVGAALVPGIGPVLGGSLLLSTLGGAALGAAAGTFIGPFIALDMTEDDAQHYARHVDEGKTVVLVRTPDRQEEARTILRDAGAYDDRMGPQPSTP